jgi:hypothetical protein
MLVATIAVLGSASALLAQGKGKGLSKALSKAGGQGSANSALNRAGQNASRVGGSLNRGNGLGRAGALGRGSLGSARGASNLPDEGNATPRLNDAATRHQRQLVIEQTNRDRRIAQAQHLREIAARNGDAELAANADRLETFANEHYRARVEQLSRFGVTDPNLPPDPGAGDPPIPQPDPLAEPANQPTPTMAP